MRTKIFKPSGLCVSLFCLILTLKAMAGMTYYQELEDVLKPQTRVFRAQVLEIKVTENEFWRQVAYRLSPIETLQGEVVEATNFSFSIPLPHQRVLNGNPTFISPLCSGSGIEDQLEVGKEYLFLAHVDESLLRVEPLERLQVLEQLLETKRP